MTYRDDHEAALARVHALEQALEQERSEDEAREERIVDLERELRDERGRLAYAEAELERLRPELPPPPAPPPPKPKPVEARPIADDPSARKQQLAVAGVITIVLLVVVVVAIATTTKKRKDERAHEYGPEKTRAPQVALPDDVSAYLAEARTRGAGVFPGGRLIELRATGIDEHGALHPQYGVVEFELLRDNDRPAAPRSDDRPIGAPKPVEPAWNPQSCAILKRTATGWDEVHESLAEKGIDLGTCMLFGQTIHRDEVEPSCTTRAIWAMALADGAPSGAIANITTTGGSWDFEIDDERAPFSKTYPDDCVPAEGAQEP